MNLAAKHCVGLQVDELIAGEVGYLAASIKAVADARVGDTITLKKQQAAEALAGERLHQATRITRCMASHTVGQQATMQRQAPQCFALIS